MILHETSGPCNLLSQSSSSVHVKQQLVKGCGAPIQKDIIYIFRPLLIFIYYNLHAQYIKLSLCIETISSCLFLERSILLSSPPTVCLDPVLTISCTYVDSTWRLFTHSPSTHTRHFKPGSCKNQPSTIQWSFFNKLLQGEKKAARWLSCISSLLQREFHTRTHLQSWSVGHTSQAAGWPLATSDVTDNCTPFWCQCSCSSSFAAQTHWKARLKLGPLVAAAASPSLNAVFAVQIAPWTFVPSISTLGKICNRV